MLCKSDKPYIIIIMCMRPAWHLYMRPAWHLCRRPAWHLCRRLAWHYVCRRPVWHYSVPCSVLSRQPSQGKWRRPEPTCRVENSHILLQGCFSRLHVHAVRLQGPRMRAGRGVDKGQEEGGASEGGAGNCTRTHAQGGHSHPPTCNGCSPTCPVLIYNPPHTLALKTRRGPNVPPLQHTHKHHSRLPGR